MCRGSKHSNYEFRKFNFIFSLRIFHAKNFENYAKNENITKIYYALEIQLDTMEMETYHT